MSCLQHVPCREPPARLAGGPTATDPCTFVIAIVNDIPCSEGDLLRIPEGHINSKLSYYVLHRDVLARAKTKRRAADGWRCGGLMMPTYGCPKGTRICPIAFTRYEHFKLVFVAVIVLQPAS